MFGSCIESPMKSTDLLVSNDNCEIFAQEYGSE